uniref:Uncharacterized protein n=1 Tax=Timema shepardi TaxID=629360 RepID=A0A7R9AX04_TIMSH|nr:unnamed protein product [Timema shepardi]
MIMQGVSEGKEKGREIDPITPLEGRACVTAKGDKGEGDIGALLCELTHLQQLSFGVMNLILFHYSSQIGMADKSDDSENLGEKLNNREDNGNVFHYGGMVRKRDLCSLECINSEAVASKTEHNNSKAPKLEAVTQASIFNKVPESVKDKEMTETTPGCCHSKKVAYSVQPKTEDINVTLTSIANVSSLEEGLTEILEDREFKHIKENLPPQVFLYPTKAGTPMKIIAKSPELTRQERFPEIKNIDCAKIKSVTEQNIKAEEKVQTISSKTSESKSTKECSKIKIADPTSPKVVPPSTNQALKTKIEDYAKKENKLSKADAWSFPSHIPDWVSVKSMKDKTMQDNHPKEWSVKPGAVKSINNNSPMQEREHSRIIPSVSDPIKTDAARSAYSEKKPAVTEPGYVQNINNSIKEPFNYSASDPHWLLKSKKNDTPKTEISTPQTGSKKAEDTNKVVGFKSSLPMKPETFSQALTHSLKVDDLKKALKQTIRAEGLSQTLKQNVKVETLKPAVKNTLRAKGLGRALKKSLQLSELKAAYMESVNLRGLFWGLKESLKLGDLGRALGQTLRAKGLGKVLKSKLHEKLKLSKLIMKAKERRIKAVIPKPDVHKKGIEDSLQVGKIKHFVKPNEHLEACKNDDVKIPAKSNIDTTAKQNDTVKTSAKSNIDTTAKQNDTVKTSAKSNIDTTAKQNDTVKTSAKSNIDTTAKQNDTVKTSAKSNIDTTAKQNDTVKTAAKSNIDTTAKQNEKTLKLADSHTNKDKSKESVPVITSQSKLEHGSNISNVRDKQETEKQNHNTPVSEEPKKTTSCTLKGHKMISNSNLKDSTDNSKRGNNKSSDKKNKAPLESPDGNRKENKKTDGSSKTTAAKSRCDVCSRLPTLTPKVKIDLEKKVIQMTEKCAEDKSRIKQLEDKIKNLEREKKETESKAKTKITSLKEKESFKEENTAKISHANVSTSKDESLEKTVDKKISKVVKDSVASKSKCDICMKLPSLAPEIKVKLEEKLTHIEEMCAADKVKIIELEAKIKELELQEKFTGTKTEGELYSYKQSSNIVTSYSSEKSLYVNYYVWTTTPSPVPKDSPWLKERSETPLRLRHVHRTSIIDSAISYSRRMTLSTGQILDIPVAEHWFVAPKVSCSVSMSRMAGDGHVDESQLKGLSKYFNSTTIRGRANSCIHTIISRVSPHFLFTNESQSPVARYVVQTPIDMNPATVGVRVSTQVPIVRLARVPDELCQYSHISREECHTLQPDKDERVPPTELQPIRWQEPRKLS